MDTTIQSCPKWLAIIIVVLGIAIIFSFISPKPSQAACRCVASNSALLGSSGGAWKSVPDGGALCDLNGRYSEGAVCDPLKETYINLWFCVPTLADLIGNIIRIAFFVSGMMALFMLLIGAFEWISSGGDEKKVKDAQARMIASVVGLIVMVSTLTVVIIIEQVIFGGKMCLGISCPLNLSQLSIIDDPSPSGRRSCFDPASRPPSPTPSLSISVTVPVSTIRPTYQISSISPSVQRKVIIITATPKLNQMSVSPSVAVSIVPTPTTFPILPGTGYGDAVLPTIPTIVTF